MCLSLKVKVDSITNILYIISIISTMQITLAVSYSLFNIKVDILLYSKLTNPD